MKVYLVRHGESLGNADNSVYATTPDYAIPLTTLGRGQAYEAGVALKKILQNRLHRTAFVYSPYVRAAETSKIIATVLGANFDEWSEVLALREHDQGDSRLFDQKQMDEDRHAFGKFWFRYPNGESTADLHDRVMTYTVDCFDERGDDLVIVAHARTIQVLIKILLGLTVEGWSTIPSIANGQIIELTDDNRPGYFRLTSPLPNDGKEPNS